MIVCLSGASLLAQGPPVVPAPADVRDLAVGPPVARGLTGGDRHEYRLALSADQFLYVVVAQHGIDVVVQLSGPDGATLVEVNSPYGNRGSESLFFVTHATGTHRLVVKGRDAAAPPGAYSIGLRELRAATPQDRARADAERLVGEAEVLGHPGTGPASRAAMQKYEAALAAWRAAALPDREARTLLTLANLSNDLGEYAQAVAFATASASAWETIRDAAGQAQALNALGTAYAESDHFPDALAAYHRALTVSEGPQHRAVRASILSNLALTYESAGQLQRALEYHLQAQPLFAAGADRLEEARGLSNLALTYRGIGEYQKALDGLLASLALRRQFRDRTGESTTLNNLGLVYDALGDYRTALRYFEESLALKDRGDIDRPGRASTLMNMAVELSRLRDFARRTAIVEEALALSRAVGSRSGLANVLNTIGVMHLDDPTPDPARATGYLTEALSHWVAAGQRNGQAAALLNLGRASLQVGDVVKASAQTDDALALCRSLPGCALEGRILFQQARLAQRREEPARALALMSDVIDIEERQRLRVAGADLRRSYFSRVQGVYDAYVDAAMQRHQDSPGDALDQQALAMVERGRARNLLERLTTSGSDIQQHVDPALLRQEREIQTRLDAALASAAAPPGERSAAAVSPVTRADQLLAELAQVRSRLRATSPEYAALVDTQPLTVKEIQTQVVDAETVLLEYSLGRERAYLWAVTPERVDSFSLGPTAAIQQAATTLHALMSARNQRPAGETVAERLARLDRAVRDFPAASRALSDLVLAPVQAIVKGKRIAVAAAGTLQLIPFAALPIDSSGTPLMVDHEVVHVPSASAVSIIRRQASLAPRPPLTLAMFADPVFDAADSRVTRPGESAPGPSRSRGDEPAADWWRAARAAGAAADGAPLPRLRYSRDEADAILALVPPAARLRAVDFGATRTRAMSDEVSRYRIVHFATHGFVNDARPELSGIVLSMVGQRGEPVDGFLRLYQIHNLRLHADLVVLSACQTALGADVRGEGTVGLTRGFMYAGAARVISSLWKVDDQATAALMTQFYRNLLGRTPQRPAAALRAAQIAMWRQARWRDPYYWAAFTLQGEWR